mmetsp:Transcript_9621/g.28151  ORF Transcript_9621/g.28151 Transcript_9621/m.28151 type:complete len:336 (+) Transcript_9621:375-1382(+)
MAVPIAQRVRIHMAPTAKASCAWVHSWCSIFKRPARNSCPWVRRRLRAVFAPSQLLRRSSVRPPPAPATARASASPPSSPMRFPFTRSTAGPPPPPPRAPTPLPAYMPAKARAPWLVRRLLLRPNSWRAPWSCPTAVARAAAPASRMQLLLRRRTRRRALPARLAARAEAPASRRELPSTFKTSKSAMGAMAAATCAAPESSSPLPWRLRARIATHAARGLAHAAMPCLPMRPPLKSRCCSDPRDPNAVASFTAPPRRPPKGTRATVRCTMAPVARALTPAPTRDLGTAVSSSCVSVGGSASMSAADTARVPPTATRARADATALTPSPTEALPA